MFYSLDEIYMQEIHFCSAEIDEKIMSICRRMLNTYTYTADILICINQTFVS